MGSQDPPWGRGGRRGGVTGTRRADRGVSLQQRPGLDPAGSPRAAPTCPGASPPSPGKGPSLPKSKRAVRHLKEELRQKRSTETLRPCWTSHCHLKRSLKEWLKGKQRNIRLFKSVDFFFFFFYEKLPKDSPESGLVLTSPCPCTWGGGHPATPRPWAEPSTGAREDGLTREIQASQAPSLWPPRGLFWGTTGIEASNGSP